MDVVYATCRQNFKKTLTEVFCDTILQLSNSIATLFPSCAKSKAFASQVATLLQNQTFTAQFVSAWNGAMTKEIQGNVSYKKAVLRLTGRALTYMDACNYNDARTVFLCPDLVAVMDIDIEDKLDSEELSAAKSALFDMIRQLNMCASLVINDSPPRETPTRQQIADNIRSQKKKPVGVGGSSEIVKTMLHDIMFSAVKIQDDGWSFTEEALQSCEEFKSQTYTDQTLLNELTEKGVFSCETFSDLVKCELKYFNSVCLADMKLSDESHTEILRAIKQIEAVTRVTSKIPAGMLDKIHSHASKLTNDGGGLDLANMDIQQISRDMMNQLSADDIQQLTSNVGSLLPEIANLSESMPEISNNPQLKTMMQAMGSFGKV
jgi:hypothetical protein